MYSKEDTNTNHCLKIATSGTRIEHSAAIPPAGGYEIDADTIQLAIDMGPRGMVQVESWRELLCIFFKGRNPDCVKFPDRVYDEPPVADCIAEQRTKFNGDISTEPRLFQDLFPLGCESIDHYIITSLLFYTADDAIRIQQNGTKFHIEAQPAFVRSHVAPGALNIIADLYDISHLDHAHLRIRCEEDYVYVDADRVDEETRIAKPTAKIPEEPCTFCGDTGVDVEMMECCYECNTFERPLTDKLGESPTLELVTAYAQYQKLRREQSRRT